MLGMLLVNYYGGYAACPQVLKHTHDYCSYADTIMPHFLFAVGFSLRLTFGRRVQSDGLISAYARMARRLLGLVLVSLVIYTVGPRAANWEQLSQMGLWEILHEPVKRGWFQTLMHIAVTSLWILPVVRSGAAMRIAWMVGSALAHIGLSFWFNFEWVNTAPNGIDGGPLGFLTWTIPAMLGTLACDVFVSKRAEAHLPAWTLSKVLITSGCLMLLGYAASCGTRLYDVPAEQVANLSAQKLAEDPVWPASERIQQKLANPSTTAWLAEPPFVKPPDATQRKWNYWMMTQRAGSLSYLTFSAGFSLAVFVLFYVLCDRLGLQLPLFGTFGTNALVAYVLHSLVSDAVHPFFPEDSPAWYAISGLMLFFLVNWTIVRHLEKNAIFLRV